MDIPNCKICTNPFDLFDKLPLILPYCGHTYCKACLQNLMSTTETSNITCPEDNQVHSKDLPQSPHYQRTAQKHNNPQNA